MLKINFTNPVENEYEIEGKLFQYDFNQDVVITGLNLPVVLEVDFSTTEKTGSAISCDGFTTEGNITTARIPNSILADDSFTQDYKLFIFIYVTDENRGRTLHKIKTKIYARPKADGYETPVDRPPFEQAVEEVKKYSEAATQASQIAIINANISSQSASLAQSYAESSENFFDNTYNYQHIASTYASGAMKSASEAKEYKENASAYAQNAYTFSINASKSASEAEQSKNQAGNYANIAKTSEVNCGKSEAEAKKSAQVATYAKNDAQQARNEAVQAYEKIKEILDKLILQEGV